MTQTTTVQAIGSTTITRFKRVMPTARGIRRPQPGRVWLAAVVLLQAVAGYASEIIVANENYRVESFREIDREFVRSALQRINNLTTTHFGARLSGRAEQDLGYLQRLLDEGLVDSDDTATLQAMGVAFGETLRQERYLKWVRYIDRAGASRALQLAHEDYYIYPLTLISRRASVGANVDLQALFQRNLSALDAYKESQRYD